MHAISAQEREFSAGAGGAVDAGDHGNFNAHMVHQQKFAVLVGMVPYLRRDRLIAESGLRPDKGVGDAGDDHATVFHGRGQYHRKRETALDMARSPQRTRVLVVFLSWIETRRIPSRRSIVTYS
jgi:hypothetical protein